MRAQGIFLKKRVRLSYAPASPVYHMQINRPYSLSGIHVLLLATAVVVAAIVVAAIVVAVVVTFSYYIISGIWVGFAFASASASSLAAALALLLMAVALAASA